MAVYERLDVLEKEIIDLITKLKGKVEELNSINAAITDLQDMLKGEKKKK